MNTDKLFLNKLVNKPKEDEEHSLAMVLCYVIEILGYEETMNMPIPAFFTFLDYLIWKAKKEKEEINKCKK